MKLPDFGTVNQQALCIGKKGSGKTTVLCLVAKNNPRVIFVDPVGTAPAPGVSFDDVDALADYLSFRETGKFRVVLYPRSDTDVLKAFDLAYHEMGNTVLIVDEIDRYFGNRVTQEIAYDAIMYGRHRNLVVCGATRRPVNVPLDIRAVLETMIVFRLTEPKDRRYVTDSVPSDDPKALDGTLRSLPQFKALWTDFDETRILPLVSAARSLYNLI